MDCNKTKPFNQKSLRLFFFQCVLIGAFGISWQHAWASAPEYVPSEVIVKYKDIALLPKQQKAIVLQEKPLGIAYAVPYPNLGVTCLHLEPGVSVERVVTEMEADPRVVYAEPNYIRHPVFTPNDPMYSSQYGPQIIDAPDAWNLTLGKSSVVIAIIDTGVDASDPDLGGHILAGIDDSSYSTGQTATGAQHDAIGHGTHVAGIAAAATNNSIGVTGIAGGDTILPIKVFPDNESASDLTVAQGIRDAADNGAQVINMSLGGPGASSTLQAAVNYAWGKGVVIVAAAGNDSSNEVFYPADATNVIAVSASNSSDGIASFSNYGSSIFVAAPGDTVLSTLPGNTYGYYSGTSMASPFVAGVAGLAFAYVPAATNTAVVAAIKAGADKIGSYTYDSTGRNDYYGYGRVNAYKTLMALTLPTSVVVSPSTSTVNTGGTQQFTAVGYDQYGNVLPSGQQPTFSWSVSGGGTISSSGLFTAGSLAGGPYTIQATAGSVSGTASVTITTTANVLGQIRFCPRSGWASRMVGGKFQVSNDNVSYTDVATVTSTPVNGAWTLLPVLVDMTQYRYLRYLSPAGGYGNVSEVEFDSGTGGTATKLTGTPFGTPGSYGNSGNTFVKAEDGSTGTYFDAPGSGTNFVGIDRGITNAVGQIRFYPRPGWASRMVGGQFQVSNDNASYTTVATVVVNPADSAWTTLGVTVDMTQYRYLRYLSPAGGYGNVSEVEFDSGTGGTATKLTGTPFGTPGSYGNSGNTFVKAEDGSTGTYFDAPGSGTNFVGIDRGITNAVGQIRFYPRPGWASRMVGGQFQVSNDNASYTTVATVVVNPADSAWTTLGVTVDMTQYRYLRYLSPAGGYGNVSEVEFDSGTGGTATKMTGTPFGTPGSWRNSGNTFDKAEDGSTGTYFDAPGSGTNSVGIDRGANYLTGFISWNGANSYLFGADYPWQNYGTDFGTGNWGKYTDWNAIATDFATMSSQGVHVARWWVFGDGRYSPDFNSDGTVSGLDGSVLSDVDQALQIAANNHISLLLTLMDGAMWSNATYSNGNNSTTVQLGGHAAIITDPTTQQTFLDNALKPLLQHIASSGNKNAVLGYDIANEPESQMAGYWGGVNLSTSSVQSFVSQCATYIHTYGGGGYATVGSASPAYVGTWKGLGLDFYQVHYYPWMDNGNAPGSGLSTYASLNLDKPCIVGEFASADGSYGLTDTAPLSAEWYLDTIYNDGYAGALAWSYNAGDSATNWASFQPVFTNWAANHHSIIGP